MATAVVLPPIATDTTEGVLARWLVEVGESVAKGQAVAEVDTAKVMVEVEAPSAGAVIRILVQEGEAVSVGRRLAWIGEPGETLPPDEEDGISVDVGASTRALGAVLDAQSPRGRIRVTPTVRRFAEAVGVELDTVVGSGPNGRILREDVERARSRPATAIGSRKERLRQAVASATSKAKREVPHFYVELEIDTSGRDNDITRWGFTVVLLAAVAHMLKHDGTLNATWDDNVGYVQSERVDLGVATATEDGLVIPIIRNADALNLGELKEALNDLVGAARTGRLRAADAGQPTFVVSNLGMGGIDTVLPIINQPAVAILGVGRRAARPVVVGESIVPRLTVKLTLSCDHRAVDGFDAARWLSALGAKLDGEAHP